jgi:hypothetical protein
LSSAPKRPDELPNGTPAGDVALEKPAAAAVCADAVSWRDSSLLEQIVGET